MAITPSLLGRELGNGPRRRGKSLRPLVMGMRTEALQLSTSIELAPAHRAPVTSLALDRVEGRYLLSSAGDGTIALYDVEERGPLCTPRSPSTPLALLNKRTRGNHTLGVTCVDWLPSDTGVFVSGGSDSRVKLWDTNKLSVAIDFHLPGSVHCIAMSPSATTHNLVATAASGSEGDVRLCDPVAGCATHRLRGHRATPLSVCWRPASEHQLASAGSDSAVRVWDVRKTNACLLSLNHAPGPNHPARAAQAAAATTVTQASRLQAEPTAHRGAVTSIVYTPDGEFMLSAARDHRLRLWRSESGQNTLVHFAGAFNPSTRMRQLAIGIDQIGGLQHARVYFPSKAGVLVYGLLSGKLLTTLKAHFGEATCCFAASADKLFSGGDDCALNVWTPPPCGISGPAPTEPRSREHATSAGLSFAELSAEMSGGGGGGADGSAPNADVDAWSDASDEETQQEARSRYAAQVPLSELLHPSLGSRPLADQQPVRRKRARHYY